MVPAIWIFIAETFMNRFLECLGEGMGSHYPQVKFQCAHTATAFVVESDSDKSHPGIRALTHDQVTAREVFRGVNVIPDGKGYGMQKARPVNKEDPPKE